jgi:hypothetical protein
LTAPAVETPPAFIQALFTLFSSWFCSGCSPRESSAVVADEAAGLLRRESGEEVLEAAQFGGSESEWVREGEEEKNRRRIDSLLNSDLPLALVDVGLNVSGMVGDDLWRRRRLGLKGGTGGRGRTVKPSCVTERR